MTKGYVLAIDQGTTGSTVLVFDRECSIKGQAYSEFTQYYPRPGWVEHDAEELWAVTHRVMKSALDSAGVGPEEIRAVGIANQRETSLLWHRKDGIPSARAIVWQDRRTSGLCDQLKREGLEPSWQEKTGLLIDPYFSGTKVRWMLENVDGLRRSARDGDIAFGTIDTWLVWKLTGGKCHIILPEVRPSSFVYGETDPDAFFGRRVPIAGIAGDQQAALFGQACYGEGLAKNTYGTGSFLLMNTGKKPVSCRERLLSTIAWRIGNEPVEYALEGSIFITGAAVQWLRDGLGIIDSAAETESLATGIQGNDDVYFVPALTGLGAPHWDSYARGIIVGLTRGTTRAHIARAALESISYQTRDVAEAMARESGIRLRELRADGGAVANRFLMQFQADMLGVPVEVPSITETTALGAAYLAGLSTGFWRSREELDAGWRMARRYEPRMDASERDRLYDRWLQAVDLARGWAGEEVA